MTYDGFLRNRLAVRLDEAGMPNFTDFNAGTYRWVNLDGWTLQDPPSPPYGIKPPATTSFTGYVLPVPPTTELTVKCTRPNANQGVVVYWTDEDNWIGLRRVADVPSLQACVAGTVTTLLTLSVGTGTMQEFTLSAYGDTYTCTSFGNAGTVTGQCVYAGSKPATNPGLISWFDAQPIESVTVTPENLDTIDVRDSATVATLDPVVTDITIEAPADVRHNDFLLAVVASNGTGTVATPDGWTLVSQQSDHGTYSATNVSLAVFRRFWRRGDPTSWATTSDVARSHIVSVASFGGVDFNTPISSDLVTLWDYFHNPGDFNTPIWVGGVGEFTQISVAAIANADTDDKIPPPRAVELWDEVAAGTAPISAWGWFGRRRTDFTLPISPIDAWVTCTIPLRPRTRLGTPVGLGHPRMLRRTLVANYVDVVLRDDPLAFWPFDDPSRADGTDPPFLPLAGTTPAWEKPGHTEGATTIRTGVFEPQGEVTAAGARTVAITNNARVITSAAPPGTFNGTEDMSFECWTVRLTDVVRSVLGITVGLISTESQSPGTLENGFGIVSEAALSPNAGGLRIKGSYGTAYYNTQHRVATGLTPAIGDLHHIVMSYQQGAGTQMYVDGAPVLSLSSETPLLNPTGGLLLAWDMAVGFVAIYQDALTDRQVLDHYRAGTNTTVLGVHSTGHAVHPNEDRTPTLGTPHTRGHLVDLGAPHHSALAEVAAEAHIEPLIFVPGTRPDLAELQATGHLDALYVYTLPRLGTDLNNPAPVGSGQYPVGSRTRPPGDVLLTEDGDRLTDEDGNPLILE